MNKIILMLLCVMPLFGCQSKENTAQTQDQGPVSQRKEAAKKLLVEAVALLEQKNVQGAVVALEASIKVNPADPDPYLLLGQILLKAEQFDHAVELLDQAGKIFPENGTVYYMLSVANKMDNKKLPAVLAARRSFDIFKAANDAENAQKSAVLLEQVIASPDNPVTPKGSSKT